MVEMYDLMLKNVIMTTLPRNVGYDNKLFYRGLGPSLMVGSPTETIHQ